MAIYLAETVTALFQRVLSHPAKGLVNETNAALLTQKFWAQAIYTELLLLPAGSERSGKGTAETTQWAGKSCLSPLRWSSRAEAWSQERHWCEFREHDWTEQLGWLPVHLVPCRMDASCSWSYPWEKLDAHWRYSSAGRCCLYWPTPTRDYGHPGIQFQDKAVAGWQKWALSHSAITCQCWLVHLRPTDLYPSFQPTLWWNSLWCLHSEGFSGMAQCPQ